MNYFVHLNIIPITLYRDIMPDFDEYTLHGYGCYLSICDLPKDAQKLYNGTHFLDHG